ncbi:S41 family peptidase [Alphaproteobacteria bacterium]|nr:S41 family peptidase [Alphaproteobacteria bacterium]
MKFAQSMILRSFGQKISPLTKKHSISLKKSIYFFIAFNIAALSNGYSETTKETYKQLSIFNEVFNRVKERYVEEVTDKELIEKALNGMLNALDPHSSFMSEDLFKEMQIDTAGAFGGLGIEITMEQGFIKIISPIDDTPAQKAGVESGDFITHLDGQSVVGLSIKEAVDIMRGEVGKPITITIVRGMKEPFDIVLKRAIIKIQSVKHKVIDDIGVLRVTTFNEQTTTGLKKIIKELESGETDIKGYVLDLRNNPGGLLDESISVSDLFLEKGEIVSVRGRDKQDVQVYSAKKGDIIKGKPLVVLINQGSASASEIVAGALQDHNRAPILGITSFGKGSVQTIVPIDSGAIRLTIAKYYTPSGDSIQAIGIEPDVVVPQAEIKVLNELFTFRESDYQDALTNETKDPNAKEEEVRNLIDDDYQLFRAIDAVKTLATVQK